MRAIFIAGTDTGVGKTVVTGLLGRYLLKKGYRVVPQKWIQTGARKIGTVPGLLSSRGGDCPYFSDIDMHLKLMGRRRVDYAAHLRFMMPYSFKLAASPHLASGMEKRSIKTDRIKKCFSDLAADFDRVIVEGAGGLLVPLNRKKLLIDLVADMGLPVVLVAANRLGAINSTLLSIEALRSRGIKLLGVIFNNVSKRENRLILEDNPAIIREFSGVDVLGVLPYTKDGKSLRKAFVPIANLIENAI